MPLPLSECVLCGQPIDEGEPYLNALYNEITMEGPSMTMRKVVAGQAHETCVALGALGEDAGKD